jgi:arylsulfatase A-like enzyme
MTSTYYSEHGLKDNRSVFDQSMTTLAEVFHRNQFSTAAFVGNAVLRKNRNLDKGFDVYNCFLPGSEINRRLPERNAEQLTNAAVAWLKSHKDERWFLWLHYQDPHAPYMPPSPYDNQFKLTSTPVLLNDVEDFTGKGGIPNYAKIPGIFDLNTYVAKYDGEIFFADKEIGRFFKELVNAELMERTIVAVTADHGESLGENGHYFAHGHNVTPELLDVPLILHGENINPQMLQHRVSLIDLPSTLLKLTGIEKPKSFRGKDLFVPEQERVLFAEQPDKRWAAFKGNDEAIYERTGEFSSPTRWNDGKKIIDQFIQQHVSGGLLLRFAEFNGTVILKSDRDLKRIHLSGGEEQDRIFLADKEASIVLTASGNDVDWIFVEPAPDAQLNISGVDVFNSNGEPLNSPFQMNAIPVGGKSSTSNKVSIVRIDRRTKELNISTEQAEELKSLGYVAN